MFRQLSIFFTVQARKPSWCKGKRATAVPVRRPRAQKSTANQRKEHNVEKYIQWVTRVGVAASAGLSSFFSHCWLPNLRNPREFELIAVQCHPRWSTFLPIDSALCNFLLAINSSFRRISYSFEILGNQLPMHIRARESVGSFKTALKSHFHFVD